MTKKNISKFRMLTSIAVAAVMAFALVLPTAAYPWSTGEGPGNEAKSAITKKFDMPKGTTTPEALFTFVFVPQTIDDEPYDDGAKNMPQVGPITIPFSAADDLPGSDAVILVNKNDKSVLKESTDLAAGVQWPGVGVYVYTVSELDSGIIIPTDAINAKTHYSEAEYTVEFWVDEDENGVLFVKYVNAITIKDYIDVFYPGDTEYEKVDPTPDRWDEEVTEKIEDGFSGIIFTNTFWKSTGGGTTNPNKVAFQVTKTVTGLGSNKERDEYFTFNVTLFRPTLIEDVQEYTAYVLGANNQIVKSTANHPDTDSEGFFKVESDSLFTVKLKHGEKLMFVDLHVGARVEVEEAAHTRFIPSYEHNFDEGAYAKATDAGTAWGFPRIGSDDKGPHYLPEGNDTKADFINTLKNATPMGLDVDDLPYVVLIGVAVAGLAGFIVFKSRKKTENA